MTKKTVKRKSRRRAVSVDENWILRVLLSPAVIRWGLSVFASILGIAYAWHQGWEKVESHWRLESVQAAQDRATAAAIKAVEDKADAADKELARRAEVGRAWVFWAVVDSKATNSSQWAELCKYLKRPGDVCARFEAEAQQYRQEAIDAKRTAQAIGRDPK
jgi:hypothetical protein